MPDHATIADAIEILERMLGQQFAAVPIDGLVSAEMIGGSISALQAAIREMKGHRHVVPVVSQDPIGTPEAPLHWDCVTCRKSYVVADEHRHFVSTTMQQWWPQLHVYQLYGDKRLTEEHRVSLGRLWEPPEFEVELVPFQDLVLCEGIPLGWRWGEGAAVRKLIEMTVLAFGTEHVRAVLREK